MNAMKVFTLDELRDAFQKLEDHAARQKCDAATMWTIHYAAEEVAQILTGEWAAAADPLPVDDEEVL